jgi:tetratricopeptide (TPR) repeat protein
VIIVFLNFIESQLSLGVLLVLPRSMYERGMVSEAMKLASTGIEIATSCHSETKLLLADLCTTMGGEQLEGTDAMTQGYESLQRALNLRLAAVENGLMDPDHPQITNSYMNVGAAALGIGKIQEAVDLGEKSILLRAKREEEQIQMLAMSFHNVALAALTAGQLSKAETHPKKSMDFNKKTGKNPLALILVFLQRGGVRAALAIRDFGKSAAESSD